LSTVGDHVRFGPFSLDRQVHQLSAGEVSVQLTRMEGRILAVLAANAGRTVAYQHLTREVWGYAEEADSALAKAHVCRLRKKLQSLGDGQVAIHASLGVGYRLIAEAR
jgi:two-component system, OmpR family, response regulator